ncbi:Hypothetical protein NTJ_11044 [Nesidiocoris tenuis]|uniref:Uncharacterized protein n=1 Tax=Nesidiocoris tenuis TaxID=355587 RepID=A0ABN7B1C2_9HEMI|nr:Hypothetical protein NTJ_11044 [Nesidiocoris tenuis]
MILFAKVFYAPSFGDLRQYAVYTERGTSFRFDVDNPPERRIRLQSDRQFFSGRLGSENEKMCRIPGTRKWIYSI